VDNLFSKAVFERISAADTNRVSVLTDTNNISYVAMRLLHIPISGSLNVHIINESGMERTDFVSTSARVKNIILYELHGFDISKTSFSFQYFQDTRETNLIKEASIQGKFLRIDDKLIPITLQP
jgi:hypothetical protein